MPRRFVFDPPDRFAAIAVGEPGQRTFFLSATKGPATLNVALEKAQVALLAERIGELVEELARRGVERPPGGAAVDVLDAAAAQEDLVAGLPAQAPEPLIEAFRVGTMSITYDGERGAVILDVHQIGEDEDPDAAAQGFEAEASSDSDDDADPGDVLRVHLTLDEALRFAQQAMTVVRAGRPPCPLCGEPLGPQGHVCVRHNGYLM